MKEQEDKYLDDLTKKVFRDASLKSPSSDFIDNVMARVTDYSQATVYKPLISKSTWTIIFLGFGALISYILFFEAPTETSNWLSSSDKILFVKSSISDVLSGFKMSKTLMYATILLALMSFVQVSFLKHYFNKRLEL